jgi:hypothetical protein
MTLEIFLIISPSQMIEFDQPQYGDIMANALGPMMLPPFAMPAVPPTLGLFPPVGAGINPLFGAFPWIPPLAPGAALGGATAGVVTRTGADANATSTSASTTTPVMSKSQAKKTIQGEGNAQASASHAIAQTAFRTLRLYGENNDGGNGDDYGEKSESGAQVPVVTTVTKGKGKGRARN